MANSVTPNDIGTPDYRILVYLWDREYVNPDGTKGKSRFIVDISSLAISDIHISKERNQPDSLEVTIEYTQFKEKLKKEQSFSKNVLMPWLTEVKIQRNFKTIFAGTLYTMDLKLAAVGSEKLTLKCLGFGELFNKRLVSCSYRNMTYPEIAQALILDAQHELNWIENYGFEYSDDDGYFSEWVYNFNTDPDYKPPRALDYWWGSAQKVGVKLSANDNILCPAQIVTKAYQDENMDYHIQANNYNGEDLTFKFCYYASAAVNVSLIIFSGDYDNLTMEGSVSIPLAATTGWVDTPEYHFSFSTANVTYVAISTDGAVGIGEFQLYRTPESGDIYDLNIKQGIIDPTYVDNHGDIYEYVFDDSRMRHYHQQNVLEALYNLTKLEDDQFEYEFTEDKVFNCYKYQGCPVVDPAMIATYPGIIQDLSIERDITDIMNISYAHGDETRKMEVFNKELGSTEKKDYTRRWKAAMEDITSTARFGALAEYNTYENVNNRDNIIEKALGDLRSYADIKNVPSISVDSNIYNPDNIRLGDAIGVKVLEDELFAYINDVYRVFALDINITKDAVESMSFTLITPSIATIQIVTFPKMLKVMQTTLQRLEKR